MTLTFRISQPHDGSKALNPSVLVTVTEDGLGALRFDLKVEGEKGLTADLRGLFFHIADEELARSLSAKGELVTAFAAGADKVSNLKGGVNAEGVKAGPFDVGLAFGSAGIGKDDVREASFVLASSKTKLGLDLVEKMEFVARLTSVGEEGGERDGSLKLVAVAVPQALPEDGGKDEEPADPKDEGGEDDDSKDEDDESDDDDSKDEDDKDDESSDDDSQDEDDKDDTSDDDDAGPDQPDDGDDDTTGDDSDAGDNTPLPPPGTTQIGDWRDDQFKATEGNDTQYGNGGHDHFDGGAGDDALHGGWGRDTMQGGAGRDVLYAEGGDDSLDGGAGSDRIYAGGGNDTAQGGAGDDLIESGDGNDIAMGGAGNDEMQGEGGDDTIIGGQDDGSIKGDAITIGDNLYGNGGRDTFIFEKGDGVDMIWDFQAGIDSLVIKGYDFDTQAIRFVNEVTNNGRDGVNPLDAHGHQKLALVLGDGADAIVFNDLGNRGDAGASIRFDDVTLSIRDLWAAAEKGAAAQVPQAPALDAGAEVTGAIKILGSWWGGFQAEITVTATRDVTDWDIGLGSKWAVNNVWNAIHVDTAHGVLDLDDANWNGVLSAGQTATIGFTASTGVAGEISHQAIMEGLWIV